MILDAVSTSTTLDIFTLQLSMASVSRRHVPLFPIHASNRASVLASSITLILLAISTIFVAFVRRRQAKPQTKGSPRRTLELTWRLFITSESGMDSCPLTPAALSAALEQKFLISLTGSKIVLARGRNRYCATLSLQTAESPFVNRRVFDLEVDLGLDRKASVKYDIFWTSWAQGCKKC